MATVIGGGRCSKCRRLHGADHHPACPELVKTERSRLAWEYGYEEARRRVFIPEHRFKTLHPSRVLGYQAYQDEMDEYYDALGQSSEPYEEGPPDWYSD